MVDCFEDGYLSFDTECILFGFDLMFVKYFYCNLLVGGDVECSFNFAECTAADSLFEFEGVDWYVVHMEGIL